MFLGTGGSRAESKELMGKCGARGREVTRNGAKRQKIGAGRDSGLGIRTPHALYRKVILGRASEGLQPHRKWGGENCDLPPTKPPDLSFVTLPTS